MNNVRPVRRGLPAKECHLRLGAACRCAGGRCSRRRGKGCKHKDRRRGVRCEGCRRCNHCDSHGSFRCGWADGSCGRCCRSFRSRRSRSRQIQCCPVQRFCKRRPFFALACLSAKAGRACNYLRPTGFGYLESGVGASGFVAYAGNALLAYAVGLIQTLGNGLAGAGPFLLCVASRAAGSKEHAQ